MWHINVARSALLDVTLYWHLNVYLEKVTHTCFGFFPDLNIFIGPSEHQKVPTCHPTSDLFREGKLWSCLCYSLATCNKNHPQKHKQRPEKTAARISPSWEPLHTPDEGRSGNETGPPSHPNEIYLGSHTRKMLGWITWNYFLKVKGGYQPFHVST